MCPSSSPEPESTDARAPDSSHRLAPSAAAPWIVLKFGGTSVSSGERWATIASLVRERVDEGYRVVVVCSALSRVSNRLEGLLELAARGTDVSAELAELRDRHLTLADELGVTLNGGERHFADLESLLAGVRLIYEITPRLHARVLSAGELLSTRIGAAYLEKSGLRCHWLDARDVLEADPSVEAPRSGERSFLSATVSASADEALDRRLRALGADVLLTQGFVARRGKDTVLLGRGGSDTSAAYLASMLRAERLEIWTDVPGMYTANPRKIRDARVLLRLPYRDAEELALRGAKVLHPRCIRAAELGGVPIHVRCTPAPELPSTVITDRDAGPPRVHAVSARKGMAVISMRVDSQWQPVGLISDVSECFKRNELSIDLLASSPTNLTVSIDLEANHITSVEELEPLMRDLRVLSTPRLIESTACISIVGTGIRQLLHEWGEALRCFENETVHLLAQSANDRSVSFVVAEDSADGLVSSLHRFFFEDVSAAGGFGEPWQKSMEAVGA